jgi:hypothetical protein
MQGRWLHLENKQVQKAIPGNAHHSQKVSIAFTLGLLLTVVTLSLSGCSGGPRAYYQEDDEHYRYYETKSHEVLLVSPDREVVNATSFVTENGYPSLSSNKDRYVVGNEDRKPALFEHEILSVSEAQGPPWSIREEGYVVWNHGLKPKPPAQAKRFLWGNWPLSPPASEPVAQLPKPDLEPPTLLPMVGTTTWKSEVADWDMAGYAIKDVIDPETSGCTRMIRLDSTSQDARHSCWNRIWEVPAFVGITVIAVAAVGALLVIAPHSFSYR